MRFFFILAISLAKITFSMEEKPMRSLEEDPLIYLNIGGEHLVKTKSTLLLSGMDFFQKLLKGDFALTYDRDHNIFVDYNKNAVPLLSDFLTTHQLPEPCNLQLAQQVADYFGSEEIRKLILQDGNKIKPQWKVKSLIINDVDKNCPLNFSPLEQNSGQKDKNNIIAHLLNAHKAKIIQIKENSSREIIIRIQYKFDKCKNVFKERFLIKTVSFINAARINLLQETIKNLQNLVKKLDNEIIGIKDEINTSDLLNLFFYQPRNGDINPEINNKNNEIINLYEEIGKLQQELKKYKIECPLCMFKADCLDNKLLTHLQEIHEAKILQCDQSSVRFQYPVYPNDEEAQALTPNE